MELSNRAVSVSASQQKKEKNIMPNYTVRVDGQFIGTVSADTAFEAAKLLAEGKDYVQVTQCGSGVVEEFDLV